MKLITSLIEGELMLKVVLTIGNVVSAVDIIVKLMFTNLLLLTSKLLEAVLYPVILTLIL